MQAAYDNKQLEIAAFLVDKGPTGVGIKVAKELAVKLGPCTRIVIHKETFLSRRSPATHPCLMMMVAAWF